MRKSTAKDVRNIGERQPAVAAIAALIREK
jgi:hypothetical protein